MTRLFALLAVLCIASPAMAALTPEGLRCNGQENPLAIEEAAPLLQWQLKADTRNAVQQAYEVKVTADGGKELWTSGKVESAAQSARYAGPALNEYERAQWQVRVWDGAGQASDWSAAASWTMAPKQWPEKWIAGSEAPLPMFHSTVYVGQPIKRVIAHVCGLGQFEFHVNSFKVSDHVLDPAWTNYKKTCSYVSFDITDLMQAGENVLGIMLGNGMYNVKGGRYVKFLGSFGEPKFIFQMDMEFENGSHQRVTSGPGWRTAPGPITFSCIYGGEDYDARKDQSGWDWAGFNDSGWTASREVDGPGGVLRPQESPPVVVIEHRPAAKVTKQSDGKYEVDLGLNLSARPTIRVRGAAGAQVVIEVAERKDTPWEKHSYTYTLKGEGEEEYTPHFTTFGFQYLYISGADWHAEPGAGKDRPVLLDAGADFVSSSVRPVGKFACGYPLFNEIDAMTDHSVRSNLMSVLTDCPHREKLGWLEVSHLMGPSILYHYDAQPLYRKICRDTTEAQWDNGMVPDIAPEYTRFTGGFLESAEWGSACVQVPWLLYRWYGDRDILERQFDTMAKYTRYLASTRDDKGIPKGGLGDWYDWTPEKGHVGDSQLTPKELPAMCMLFDNARILAETAVLLKNDSAAEFKTLAEQVRKDFMQAYYHADQKTVATGSQAALAAALFFGLVPEADLKAVENNLAQALEKDQLRQSTGEVCFRYLVQALAQAGRSDLVFRMIDRTDAPGYGCMLKQFGLQTLSEQWDKPGSSLNHCMFGHIQEWFQGYILGIGQQPDSIGFERLRIAPSPEGHLTSAEGYYDSPRGRIAVQWKKAENHFETQVAVPANTQAEIVLPAGPGSILIESGKSVENAILRENAFHVNVGSGTYAFAVDKMAK